MNIKAKQIPKKNLYKHETKRESLLKYLLIVTIIVFYFVVVSLKYGIQNGVDIVLLTWSFFVFCTPIADAGFLLDFPIRLFTNIKMIYSEMSVWVIATIINLFYATTKPSVYNKTLLLRIFHQILIHPFPYWLIIILSATGTYLSVYFGDEMMDVAKHNERKRYHKHKLKYKIIATIAVFVFTLFLYEILIKNLGINIPLF